MAPPAPAAPVAVHPLLAEGGLELHLAPGTGSRARRWIPLGCAPAPPSPASDRISLRIVHPESPRSEADRAASSPLLHLGRLAVHRTGTSPARFTLTAPSGISGTIHPAAGSADLRIAAPGPDPGDAPATRALDFDVHHALTVTAALLLAGRGRALVHAAAVLAPTGATYLLVGDSRSGKSTTAANLRRLGWSLISDDQVVLSPERRVEGWLRPLHLDAGWPQGRRTGTRIEVQPHQVPGGGLARQATVSGVLLPRIEAEPPTRLEPTTGTEALAELIRQSPWLLAHPEGASRVLETLSAVAQLPAHRLRLGRDSYADATLLAAELSSLPTQGSGASMALTPRT